MADRKHRKNDVRQKKNSKGAGKALGQVSRTAPGDRNIEGHKKGSKAESFVSKTLQKGVTGVVAEFRAEKKTNDLTKMKDVGCLDENRVILSPCPTGDYIHANYVAGHENQKRFICTQAPLPETIGDFWHIVVQENTKLIVMLRNFTEQGAKKCADYFPVSVSRAVEHGRVSVAAKSIKKFSMKSKGKVDIMATELDIRVPGKPPHTCTHLHWKDWPDREVPPTDLTPIELCEYMSTVSMKSNAPIIVHCSAGIGRTGSIVLIDLLLEQLKGNLPWEDDLKGSLNSLRKQRNNSVQMEQQYLYVHIIMLNFVIHELMSPREHDFLSAQYNKFKDDYDKQCKGF